MVSGLEPLSALPCIHPRPKKKGKWLLTAALQRAPTASLPGISNAKNKNKKFPPSSVRSPRERKIQNNKQPTGGSFTALFAPSSPPTNTTRVLSRSSVLHVRLLHHISFLCVHIGAGLDLHNQSDVRLGEPPGPMGGLGSTQLKTFIKSVKTVFGLNILAFWSARDVGRCLKDSNRSSIFFK